MTNQEIKTVGQTIAQETQIGGNTAARVGGVVEGIGVALDNKDAANGYYQATISGGTITVNAPNYLLGSGGNLRIKMPSAGTTASTLTIGNANAVQLWYNGAAVSSDNTWDANEIISAFYDGTRFMASNSQGGGGKAEKIKYDNSQSGLNATDVQGAVDELADDYRTNVYSFEESSLCKRATRDVNDTSWQYKDVEVIAGDTVKILVEGNISKHSALSNARQYFEIQQLDANSQVDSTLYSVYTAIPDNNPTSRIIDSNTPTLTSKTIVYKVPINGYLRIRNRMSMASGYAVNVVVLNSVIDNSNYKELSVSELTWKNMTYRAQGDFHAAATRLSCAIDTTNVKSIKIIPKGYINCSVNEFGEDWVQEADNFTVDVPILANTNIYTMELQANSIECTMNEGSKTLLITLGKSGNSNISTSDITNHLTIYVEYKEEKKRNIRVLFIGNSLLQDAVSYMPFYMKALAPDVEFSFYLWYHSGYRLAQHLSDFENNVPATIFSTNYGTKWNQYANSMTMAQVLAKYEFDIVVIQEYFYYWYSNNLPYTDTDLQTFNDVVAWVESHSNSPFKVATFFHPPRMNATDVEPSFTFISDNIVKILKNTVAEGMLFSGIALYRALSTDLMNLGITGYLSADNVHSQEGLPCSLCAWTSIMWLLDELGMASKINNIQDYVNSTNWASLNIPGPNPTNTASNPSTYVISGTDSQKTLAQEVVVKAYRECKEFINALGDSNTDKVKYDNSKSVLSANNVQDALTEVGSMFKNETVSSFVVTNGTNLTTYTNRRLDVKKGFIEIEIDGSVSKVSGLADDREYLRIQLYDISNTLIKTILCVTTTKATTEADRTIAESNLTHLLIGTEVQSDGYIIVGERTSSTSHYELSVKNLGSTSNLVSIGNVSVSGTNSSTYVDSASLSVSAGDNLRAVIDGNISKATSLKSNQAYLRVRFTGISGTVIDLYNACTTVPSSSPNDYAPTITRKVIDFTPAEDGTVIFQNRMSNDSSFTAKLLVDADSKFNKIEKTFNDKFEKTLVINKDAVLRRGGTKGRALLNLGRIYGHVAWDITLGNNNYQYVVRLYSYDVGYYYPSGPNYDSGWLTGHSTGELSNESYQYFLLAVGRVDNQVMTDEDLVAIQSNLSGSIAYNNLSHLAKESQKKNIISNRHLQVCAHRGFHLNDVPENSIDSVRFAAMMGFDMVETDFSQTSDGELVLMHDDSINRTMVNADGTAISGTVKMINKTLAELRSNYVLKSEDARIMKPIPTLEEYFLACKKYGIFPVPEIKTWGNSNAAVLKAYEMGCEIMGKDNFAFISFGYDYLDYARTLSPNLLLGYIGESILDTVNTITGESRETPYTMWSPKYDNTHGVSAELIKQYHEKGMKVQVWTPPVAEYPYINELGADIVTTNDIGPNIGNTIGYIFDSYATWNDFITDGVFDGQTLTLDTSQQLSCNLKETIVNGKFALEINFTGNLTITAPNLSTTVTSSDADKTYIYQGVIDYKNPSLSITATAASMIKMIRYYVVPVNQ